MAVNSPSAGPSPYPARNAAFRTPPMGTEDGYIDRPGKEWAPPSLQPDPNEIPDARRLGTIPNRTSVPNGGEAPADFWLNGRGRDVQLRHNSAETIDADGWRMFRGTNYGEAKRAAPDPRRTPPPETRPTQEMSPSRYTFQRPFDQTTARRLNGLRFSMADHRRVYEVTGTAPISSRRNTYRQDPGPWDAALTDYPANTPTDWGGYHTAAIPMSGNRSRRLDSY